MSVKLERLEHTFVEQISQILMLEIKDERIRFVTVTACSITSDLSFAKVYVTVLDDTSKNSVLKLLNKASNFIEREISKRVDIRKMPNITFVYDESIEYGKKIEDKLKEINKHV